MKAIVTGAAGFIGSHLAEMLRDAGHEVVGIDDFSTGHNKVKGVKIWKRDIRDLEKMQDLFVGADVVFHLAAMGRVPMCVEDPRRAYEVNVMGSVNVLEAARRAGVRRVVLSSSCIAYSEQPTAYKTTKIAMEEAARAYRSFHGVQTVSLRYANVYGPRQEVGMDSAMFAMLRDSYNREGMVHIFGDGEQTRDWTYVTDICRANILAAESAFEGELDIATGRSISLNYIVKDVLKVPFVHEAERIGDARHIVLDSQPARQHLGFETQVTFEDGIKNVWI